MFRNRGPVPNVPNNSSGGYRPPHYKHYWNRRFIIIHYDKTFIAIELISVLIILLIVLAVYLFGYQISFEDPLSEVKQTFLNAQIISIAAVLIVTGLVTFFTRSSKENLIRNLRIIALVYILSIIVFLGIKISIDNKYNNEETFGEFYEQYEKQNNNNNNSKKINFGLSGISISEPKEAYINESLSAYTNFSTKVILYTIIQFSIVIILFYLSSKLSRIEMKRQKISKDDEVLFDDEQNII